MERFNIFILFAFVFLHRFQSCEYVQSYNILMHALDTMRKKRRKHSRRGAKPFPFGGPVDTGTAGEYAMQPRLQRAGAAAPHHSPIARAAASCVSDTRSPVLPFSRILRVKRAIAPPGPAAHSLLLSGPMSSAPHPIFSLNGFIPFPDQKCIYNLLFILNRMKILFYSDAYLIWKWNYNSPPSLMPVEHAHAESKDGSRRPFREHNPGKAQSPGNAPGMSACSPAASCSLRAQPPGDACATSGKPHAQTEEVSVFRRPQTACACCATL
jgi:hypothetical protein